MERAFTQRLFEAHQACRHCPTPSQVAGFFDQLLSVMFPNFSSEPLQSEAAIREAFGELQLELYNTLTVEVSEKQAIVHAFFEALPSIHAQLHEDVTAIYKGDPAAVDREEVIRSYPGFYAIAAYRIAHQLVQLNVPVIPRSITEYAHSKTGIDIHPAATIGARFCIDHGTGVVIGETTEIGNDVKLYQGVTLGALSVDKEMANTKRHPTIGDRVILYAGATVLGGETHIGSDVIVGGNVWLTESVPAGAKVYYKEEKLLIR